MLLVRRPLHVRRRSAQYRVVLNQHAVVNQRDARGRRDLARRVDVRAMKDDVVRLPFAGRTHRVHERRILAVDRARVAFGATSIAPSTSVHRAGLLALSADVQPASDLPSNSTTASDGGGPEGRQGPGSTTSGCGRSIECCGHCVDTCASSDITPPANSATARERTIRYMLLDMLLVVQRIHVR